MITRSPVAVALFDATRFSPRDELTARLLSLEAVVDYMLEVGAVQLVIELDESLEKHDRRALQHAVTARGVRDQIGYRHMRAQDGPLLWIADAVAWCWVKGGEWRSYVHPVVTTQIRL